MEDSSTQSFAKLGGRYLSLEHVEQRTRRVQEVDGRASPLRVWSLTRRALRRLHLREGLSEERAFARLGELAGQPGGSFQEAAEQILCEPGLGGAFHGLRDGSRVYFAKITKPRKGQLTYEQRKEAAAETIGRFVAAIRAGKFDLAPTDKCPGFCPYRHICHHTPSRAQFKARTAQEDSS